MNLSIKQLALLGMICVLSACHSVHTSDSTQFRGTNCSGIAPDSATPPTELLMDKNLKWKTTLASGVSSPCITGNKIFVTGFNSTDSALVTYCIHKNNGKILWERSVFPDKLEKIHSVGSQAAATPTTDERFVYVYFGSYGIICYDMQGNTAWEKRLSILNNQYGSCASPVIVDGKIILNRLENKKSTLIALDLSNGEIVWEVNLNSPPGLNDKMERSHATPVLWNNQIIIHRLMGITAVAAEDGRELWSLGMVTMGIGTPIINDDFLYVNGYTTAGESRLHDELPDFENMVKEHDLNGDNYIEISEIPDEMALLRRPELNLPLANDTMFSWKRVILNFDSSKDKKMDKAEWSRIQNYFSKWMKAHGVVAIRLNKENAPEMLWKVNDYVSEVPSLLYCDNRIYMITNGGIFTCMDSKTGKVIYRERAGVPGAYISSPLLANNYLYLASYSGKITVLKPGDELKIVSKADLNERIAASPVAVDNYLFLRTLSSLYAFED